mgnify:CR=1 FL=1
MAGITNFAAATILLVNLVLPFPVLAQTVSGPAETIDGDTLSLTGIRVRLQGIDAPESKQTCEREAAQWSCGQEARETLAALVGSGSISCTGQKNDRWGRLLARCRSGSVVAKPPPDVARPAPAKTVSEDYRDTSERCAIKGNHSRKGELIYHLPGQTYYNQTRPEAMFCSEAEARAAGYRKSKI